MPPSPAKTRKPLVAGLLILVAGLLGLLARAPQSPAPPLPDMAPAFAAAHVHPLGASAVGDAGSHFRQWSVENASGLRALVYLEATRAPQRVLEWTGQLGYQGDGYRVSEPATRTLSAHGTGGEVSTAYLTGSGGRLAMAATDLGPDGPGLGGASAAPRLLLDEVEGHQSLWYLVRVTIVGSGRSGGSGGATDQATRLLASLVPALARARSTGA